MGDKQEKQVLKKDVERSSFSLPDELLLIIFSHLSIKEIVQTVQNVCKHWRMLASDHKLWQKWLFPSPKETSKPYKCTLAQNPEIYSVSMPEAITDHQEIKIFCGSMDGQQLEPCDEMNVPVAVRIGTAIIKNLESSYTRITCTVTTINKECKVHYVL